MGTPSTELHFACCCLKMRGGLKEESGGILHSAGRRGPKGYWGAEAERGIVDLQIASSVERWGSLPKGVRRPADTRCHRNARRALAKTTRTSWHTTSKSVILQNSVYTCLSLMELRKAFRVWLRPLLPTSLTYIRQGMPRLYARSYSARVAWLCCL